MGVLATSSSSHLANFIYYGPHSQVKTGTQLELESQYGKTGQPSDRPIYATDNTVLNYTQLS